jgi:tRNA-dihydrouridine synthase
VGVQAITVHGRTRCQFYKGSADWGAVAAVKAATRLPVVVNGDILDAETARRALALSGADAVMIGRGLYGRPWMAASVEAELWGQAVQEPDREARLALVLDHMGEARRFYGDRLGLRTFRKHLGWYVEQAPWPADPQARRTAKSILCRLESALEVEAALMRLWLG